MQAQTRFGYPARTCMWTRYLLLLVSFAVQFFFSQATLVASEIYDCETEYFGGGILEDFVYTRMWIPDDVETVRGIFIIGNPSNNDTRSAVNDRKYRALAEMHDFAVIGTAGWGWIGIVDFNITIWEDHIADLASQSGHPELVNAPWAPWGRSNGGQMSYGFNALRPEKVIACVLNKAPRIPITPENEEALKTPAILVAGEKDTINRNESIRETFEENRPRGALWSWVEEPGVQHNGIDERLFLPFMDQAIRLRYPEDQVPTATSGVVLKDLNETDGWLADQSTWHNQMTEIAPYDEYAGDPENAGWLMNEGMANLYRAFSTYDKDVFLEPSFEIVDDCSPWPEVVCQESDDVLSLCLDTRFLQDWSKIELYDYDQCIQTIYSTGVPTVSVDIIAPTMHPGVHGLFVLVTHADGVTVSTTDAIAYILVPEPSEFVGFLAIVVAGFLARRD